MTGFTSMGGDMTDALSAVGLQSAVGLRAVQSDVAADH